MIQFISGGISKDNRGQIRFVNEFDMKDVKRFYLIKNSDTKIIRGWRAHKIEQRWFYVLKGSFQIALVEIDNWKNPSKDLKVEEILINSAEERIVHVPSGFGTALKAMEQDSEIMVFADHSLDHAQFDDYTFDINYFINYNQL